ncbi:TylF/MycF/NovP-related O-methyltransferase [Dongia sedimenti]|uniref:TylF/MycF/NovP-related O-methyltransferase n=1 Tax=Dongia sedimenti TaxID=3064282 RepID=A0ABU0YHG8_9PROT|nr:TylF/MycF/NovP-related O-methyltransferase [Rhodospirillaceae bacterium R-7]
MVEQVVNLPVKLEVKFPLPDGRMLVQGPLTYNTDGLATQHNSEFMRDPRFAKAYAFGMTDGPPGRHLEWRVHVALWLAEQSVQLGGDFIECGVNTGIMSGAIMTYLDFAQLADRRFYLLDTFAGIPEEQITDAERAVGVAHMNVKYQGGDRLFDIVKSKFSPWPNKRLIRGMVPDTLVEVDSDRIAFAHIDMNVVAAEIAAAEFLWPRLQPGAFMLLDDYGWAPHIHQKRAWDVFAQQHGFHILSLPTGQGLIMKPR